MQLSEEALRLASEELNRLAKQKEDLEKYLVGLNRNSGGQAVFKEQSLFVENQVRALLQGWAKATPAMRKRLLRRTIKEIIITRDEMQITFWLSAEERDESLFDGPEIGSDEAKKVLAFRGISPRRPNRNLSIISSGVVRNGRALFPTDEKCQPHETFGARDFSFYRTHFLKLT